MIVYLIYLACNLLSREHKTFVIFCIWIFFRSLIFSDILFMGVQYMDIDIVVCERYLLRFRIWYYEVFPDFIGHSKGMNISYRLVFSICL